MTRTARLERLRPRAAGPADRIRCATTRATRPLCRRATGSEAFAAIGARAEGARSEVGRLLRVRAAPASRPPTSTRCSRGSTATTTCPTARTCATRRTSVALKRADRRAGRHGACLTIFDQCRRDLLLRPERRHQQPALPAPAAGGGERGVPDHHLQPACASRASRASSIRRTRPRC